MANSNQESGIDRAWELQRISIESQNKYAYFMVGLTFAILGLSIEITDNITWITIVSWSCFLLSAIGGIFYIQWNFTYYSANGKKIEAENKYSSLEKYRAEGRAFLDPSTRKVWTEEEIKKEMNSIHEGIKSIKGQMDKIWKNQFRRFNIQTWGFMAGIIGLWTDKILSALAG